MSAGQLAALIAAGFFAVGMCALVFVLLRLAGLISHANRIMTDYGDRAGTLIERAQAAVDRTNEQLARTDSITASMDEVTSNMADLSGHVADLAGLARGISAGLGSAAAAGLRVRLRRPHGRYGCAARPARRRWPRPHGGKHCGRALSRAAHGSGRAAGDAAGQRGWGSGGGRHGDDTQAVLADRGRAARA